MVFRDRPLSRTRHGNWRGAALVVWLAAHGSLGCSALVDTSTKSCTTHAQCRRRFDDSAYCRHDGVCATLFTEECSELYWFGEGEPVTTESGDLPDTNTVIIGFMGPADTTAPGDVAYAEPLRTAAHEAIKSIQRVFPKGTPQTLALLDCNDANDPAAVFRHLAESVRAPAVIGPVFSSTTLKVLDTLDSAGDTLLLSPSATAINFTEEVSPRLWRTVPPDTYQVDALIALYQKLAAEEPSRNLKLRVVGCEQEGWCDSFLGTLVGELARAGIDHETLSYDREKREDELAALATQLKADKPDVVIGVGIGELGELLLPALETGADAIAPIYLFPEAERGTGLEEAIHKLPERNLPFRVLGTAPGPRVAQDECGGDLGTFLQKVTDGNLGEFAYDAAFLLAYALSSGQHAHPTGLQLTDSLSSLSCKDSGKLLLQANPQRYMGMAKKLGQSPDSCADYCGVSGPLDYPTGALTSGTNREAPSDIGFWCPSVASNGEVNFKVPPGDFGPTGDATKPYYAVTSEPSGIQREAQLRLCKPSMDAGVGDAGMLDAGGSDAGAADAGMPDAGAKDGGASGNLDATTPVDARTEDARG